MEKFKSQLVLTSVKKYYKKEEPSKISGLGLKLLDFKSDQMNPKTVLASLWLFDQTNWSIYLRHKNIYDDVIGQADDRGYYDLKTQHPVLLSYHLNDKNYKDVDEIEFINIKTEQKQFTGFTDEDVTDMTKKAKEEVLKEDAKSFAPHKQDFTTGNKLTEKPESANKKPNYPDWDKIAEGKVRHGIAVAFIETGITELTEEVKTKINTWTKFVMGGK
jgi:hypothetical protein